ncbi:MAG: cadmium-translocating P-type ATPase [[Eubacterium] brachy]|nr:cadmium-translocating P-type ATPase [[Eubacterium] brachy]
MNKKQRIILWRIFASAVLLLLGLFVDVNQYVTFGLLLASYLLVGYDVIIRSLKNITRGQVFDENFLMTIATLGAFYIREFKEGVMVMLLYQVGELFQSYAVGKSRTSIYELMNIRPDYANLIVDGQVEVVDPDDVEVGSIIQVKAGEKVPLDGVVVRGSSFLDTSALTGESVPRQVGEGDEILSGYINQNGLLEIRTTKEFDESTASKILELVENASSKKAKAENFITKFAKYYTPVVVIGAVLLAFVPPLAGSDIPLGMWIKRACTLLVISCPCALVISVPLGLFGGIGGAAKEGILIKGGNYIEAIAKMNTVVFDKTGTLTKGVFKVSNVYSAIDNDDENQRKKLLELAAVAESYSNHPISISLKNEWGREIDKNRVSDVDEVSGKGVVAKIDQSEVFVGNVQLMADNKVDVDAVDSAGTVVYVAQKTDENRTAKYLGYIEISDEVRAEAVDLMRELGEIGVKNTIMLTGDRKQIAEKIARDLKVGKVYSELLPKDKVEKLDEIISHREGKHTVGYVGDGINDAPVLTRADVGIAMGGIGSDAAIEAADLVIMKDDLSKIGKAVKIARKTMGIVHQNIVFALGVKALFLVLGSMGNIELWEAVFADVGVAVLAILNAMRTLKTR